MKTTIEHKITNGRLVNGEPASLYLRIDKEDDQVVSTAIGIEQKGGKVSWQIVMVPIAITEMSQLLRHFSTPATP